MDETFLLPRRDEGQNPLDGLGIAGMLIGPEHEGRTMLTLPEGVDDGHEALEGSCERAARGEIDPIVDLALLALVSRHSAFAPQGRVRKSIQDLGIGTDEDIDGIGEELGTIEAFEAIGAEILVEDVTGEEARVHSQAVSTESIVAVLHAGDGAAQVPRDGRKALRGRPGPEDLAIVQGFFAVIIDGTGAFRKAAAAVSAREALDDAADGGEVGPLEAPESGGVGCGFVGMERA